MKAKPSQSLAGWSELALLIAAMYLHPKEKGVHQLLKRVSQELSRLGIAPSRSAKVSLPLPSLSAQQWLELLSGQWGAFNSPVWFNLGLFTQYGIAGDGFLFGWNRKKNKVEKILGAYRRPQISACFIQSIDDSLEGIFELAKVEARLFKYGSGSGTNFSSLRSRFEDLANGGKSSGLISFLEVLDRGAGAVKSAGTTRRAAKMVVLDIHHPEILDFVRWKSREEEKAMALIRAGWDSAFEGEAYRSVSGQNANLSVRVTDEFGRQLRKNGDFALRKVASGRVHEKISSRSLWREIATAAWRTGDPGVQFHSTIQKWHTCPNDGEIRASNPCSEFLFLDNTACNLASVNLLKFVPEFRGGPVDVSKFAAVAKHLFIAQESLIDHAGYPTEEIARNSVRFRPLGLGLTGLGAFLMRSGIAYDSPAGRAWGAAWAALLTGVAYETSAEMAAGLGAFSGYRKNRDAMLTVLHRHRKYLAAVDWQHLPADIRLVCEASWQRALRLGERVGFRNSQATVLAPAGTIGLLMDSETTGIEPEFSLRKTKKLVGGKSVQTASPSVQLGLEALGISSQVQSRLHLHLHEAGTVLGFSELTEAQAQVFATALEISSDGHLLMMANMQKFISGGISKTVNLPATATVDDVQVVYERAWELGLKSVSIYRDGSKASQPLKAMGTTAAPVATRPCPLCQADIAFAPGCGELRCTRCGWTSLQTCS